MSSKLVIYTCVTSGYDAALMDARTAPGFDWICFTDKPQRLRAEGWQIRPLQSPPDIADGHYINRYHKFFAQRLFPEAEWSIYIDGSLEFSGDFGRLQEWVMKAKAALGLFMHPHQHDLRKEAEVCALSKFDARDFAVIDEQLAAINCAGVSLDRPIPTGYLLVRDHRAPALASAMDLWWDQVHRFTKRDQISLPYVLHKSGLPWIALDRDVGIDPTLVKVRPHAPLPIHRRILRRFRRILLG